MLPVPPVGPFSMPVADDGRSVSGKIVVVVGKHISQCGLSFYHPKPLPYRRMIASLETSSGHWLGFLVDLKWCRFTKRAGTKVAADSFESVPSPLEGAEQSGRNGLLSNRHPLAA